MPIRFHSTALFVKDIEISKQFYTELLGQTVQMDFDGVLTLDCGVTLWQIQSRHIIPQTIGTQAVSDSKSNRFELYFETGELEATFKRLTQAGVSFLHPIHEEPWGQRTFRLFDPDNHLVEIGEPLEIFVRNLFDQGLTVEEITRKTGVPVEMVKETVHR